jgi:TRAP-type C4-dicarboxylate transport system permease small subunit
MLNDDATGGEAPGASSPEFPDSRLTRAIGWLALAASVVSAGLVLVTLAVTGFSVFRRYVLGQPLTWSDELSGFLVVAIVMLGAAEVLRKGEHVSVDVLSEKAVGGSRRLLALWSNLSVAVVAGVIFASGVGAVRFSLDFGIYSDGYLEAPLWIPQSFMLVGAGLLCLLAVARCLDLIFMRRRKP